LFNHARAGKLRRITQHYFAERGHDIGVAAAHDFKGRIWQIGVDQRGMLEHAFKGQGRRVIAHHCDADPRLVGVCDTPNRRTGRHQDRIIGFDQTGRVINLGRAHLFNAEDRCVARATHDAFDRLGRRRMFDRDTFDTEPGAERLNKINGPAAQFAGPSIL